MLNLTNSKYFEKYLEIMLHWISNYSLKLIAAIIIVLVGVWLSKRMTNMLKAVLEKNNLDVTLIGFLSNITYYTLIIMVLIAAAGQLGINTTSFLTIVGAAGLAVGLALKDSLSNFSAGVMLILFRPVRVGDFVTVGGVSGTVEEITIFNTILSTPDNQKVIVPNNDVTTNIITNVTANPTRRIDMVIGISYDDDIKVARDVLRTVIENDSRILKEPAVRIAVSELADSSVNFVVRPWVKTSDYWDVYFDLTENIKIALDDAGINIPYPQQDVHLYKATGE